MDRKINPGVYVVVDPAQDKSYILNQLSRIKDKAVSAVQLWDNPNVKTIDEDLIKGIIRMFKEKAPLLINNKWELLNKYDFDGVHFDDIPNDFNDLVSAIDRDFIRGATIGNDLDVVERANSLDFDYVSFCAMFPSVTSGVCEIVQPETVRKCRKLTNMPIFLAGGITPDNLHTLNGLSFQGVAVVSGIMNAQAPEQVLKAYELQLKELKICN